MRIYGASDDLVEIEGHENEDEVDCYDQQVKIDVGDSKGGLHVVMLYGMIGACWSAEITPWDEDVPIPWAVAVGAEKYSTVVTIDCPKDAPMKITKLKRKATALREENDHLHAANEDARQRILKLETELTEKDATIRQLMKAGTKP